MNGLCNGVTESDHVYKWSSLYRKGQAEQNDVCNEMSITPWHIYKSFPSKTLKPNFTVYDVQQMLQNLIVFGKIANAIFRQSGADLLPLFIRHGMEGV